MLADLAVLEAVDVNFGPGDAIVSRRLAHHRAPVGRDSGTALDDPVAGSDQILLGYDPVRKGAVHHDPDLPQAFQARRQRRTEMVDEVRIEEMADAVDVV